MATTSRTPRPWHDIARRMRKEGHGPRAVGLAVGLSDSAVCEFFRQDEGRAYQRKSRKGGELLSAHSESGLIARHKPRVIPPKVDPMIAAGQFARGEIDRAELSRRLRGEV